MQRVLGVVCLVAAALFALPAAGASTTSTVCVQGPPACDHASIQAAVIAASPGTTVRVHPGTYTETVVVNTSGLTITGVDDGPVEEVPQGAGATEAVLVGALRTSPQGVADLTVRGLRVVATGPEAMRLRVSGRATVADVHLVGSDPDVGAGLVVSRFDELFVTGSTVEQFAVGLSADGRRTVAVTIRDNDVHDFGVAGVSLNGSMQGTFTVMENRIHDGGAASHGIGIATDDTVVSENRITGVGTGILLAPDAGGLSRITITRNVLRGNATGLHLLDGPAPVADNTVERNAFEGNGVGLRTDRDDVMAAPCNWWGSPTGPANPVTGLLGLGDATEGDVETDFWLLTPDPDLVCPNDLRPL